MAFALIVILMVSGVVLLMTGIITWHMLTVVWYSWKPIIIMIAIVAVILGFLIFLTSLNKGRGAKW